MDNAKKGEVEDAGESISHEVAKTRREISGLAAELAEKRRRFLILKFLRFAYFIWNNMR